MKWNCITLRPAPLNEWIQINTVELKQKNTFMNKIFK